MSFITELRRRNVFRVAIVYLAVAWLLLQISDTLAPALYLPEWIHSAVAFLLILGFPVAIIFAWAFELTPEGLKPEKKADAAKSTSETHNRQFGPIVFVALALALGYFVVDTFVLGPGGEPAESSIAEEASDPPPAPASANAPDNSIAVLPFINMSSDEEQEYFSDGLSEELLNLLSRIPEMQVAARTSSFSFKDKDLEVTEIASRLNVAHVLEGSVRKHDDQLRITAQLVQADNGYQLWSETYDRKLDNVFQIQEEIALAVVDALRINLLGEAPRVRKTDPAAYQLYLEGQYLKRQISRESLHLAIEAFRKAVDIDPTYAPAWAELADTYMWIGGSETWPRAEITVLADEAVQNAIRHDPDYAFAYYVRGVFYFFRKLQFREGLEDFRHALELNPDDAFLVAAIGKGALLTANYDHAIAQYQKALAMEPVVPEFHYFLGKAYLGAGRLDEAEATFRKLASLIPGSGGTEELWETRILKGELEEALAESDTNFKRAVTHFALGNKAEADEALAALIERGSAYSIALVFGYRDDADRAFEWLNRMLEDPIYLPTFILTEPAFQSIHADERWPQLLARLGLLEFWENREAVNPGRVPDI